MTQSAANDIGTQLDVIIPFYNPPSSWAEDLIRQAGRFASSIPRTHIHWILVNDGSTQNCDDSIISRIKEQLNHVTYLSYEVNRGKGYALRHGFAKSSAPYSAFTDVDMPYSTANMTTMYKTLIEHNIDLIIGHRSSAYYQKIPISRRWISRLFILTLKSVFRLPFGDTQSGLKFFSSKGRDVLLSTKINSFLIDLEMVRLSTRKNLRMESLPLQTREGFTVQSLSIRQLLKESASLITILLS